MSEWLTATEAAKRLGIDVTMVRRLARTGTLRAVKRNGTRWRFDPDEVARYRPLQERLVLRAAAILEAGEKRCPRCRQWLSLPAFGRASKPLDRHTTVCRRCRREYDQGRKPGPPDRAVPEWPPGRPA